MASSTPSQETRKALSAVQPERATPPRLLGNVYLRLVGSHKKDYKTVNVNGLRQWDSFAQVESFFKSNYGYFLGDSFTFGYLVTNTHVEVRSSVDLQNLWQQHSKRNHITLWAQASTNGKLLQCVTASKKLTYKKLQADFFEKLYPKIRN